MANLPSKHHTLDLAEFNAMLEPVAGTEVFYEKLNDCSVVSKRYPANSTVIANMPVGCGELHVYGDIKKFILEEALGKVFVGDKLTHIQDVVIDTVSGIGQVVIQGEVTNLEVRYLKDNAFVRVEGAVRSHVDVKRVEYRAEINLQ